MKKINIIFAILAIIIIGWFFFDSQNNEMENKKQNKVARNAKQIGVEDIQERIEDLKNNQNNNNGLYQSKPALFKKQCNYTNITEEEAVYLAKLIADSIIDYEKRNKKRLLDLSQIDNFPCEIEKKYDDDDGWFKIKTDGFESLIIYPGYDPYVRRLEFFADGDFGGIVRIAFKEDNTYEVDIYKEKLSFDQ